MGLLISWALLTIVVFITAAIVPGFRIRGFTGAVLVAALFGILNFFLGWLLFVAIGLGTLGLGFVLAFLTRWIVDAIVLKMVDTLSKSLEIESFGRAFLAALVMSGLGTLLEFLMLRL
jgi:putative membrane protein